MMAVPSRVRWRCRRGTKELDYLLLRFVEAHYESLDDAERTALESLLSVEDDRLIDWLLTGKGVPDDPTAASLAQRIRCESGL